MSSVLSTNARTSATRVVASQTARPELDQIVSQAVDASTQLAAMPRARRALLLRGIADELEARTGTIVAVADEESAIGVGRLEGEMTRTCTQLRAFADVLDDGGYLEATIDHARTDTTPPRPDLRRMLIALGPVAVFGASNFPLAFSVPGGDTASALAAGCAVVAKVHESHPATSIACYEAIKSACLAAGAPASSLQLVFGREAGVDLVTHAGIRAGAFTGSLGGGKALLDAVNGRPDPIPFYAEMASINPVVVSPGAAGARGAGLGAQLGQSLVTLSGQICTKPGLVFVPVGADGDEVVSGIRDVVTAFEPQQALNAGIAQSFRARAEEAVGQDGLAEIGAGSDGAASELAAHLLSIDIDKVGSDTVQESFGPVQMVARYRDLAELSAAAGRLAPSLTATIHAEADELSRPELVEVVRGLEQLSGRMIFNGVPTGVAVAWGQHHGGPWPATNSLHTSVGASAIRRFLRPFTWQDSPSPLLPEELRDEVGGLPRRVDGTLVL